MPAQDNAVASFSFDQWKAALVNASKSELVNLIVSNPQGSNICDAAFDVLHARVGFSGVFAAVDAEKAARLEEWSQHIAEIAREALAA